MTSSSIDNADTQALDATEHLDQIQQQTQTPESETEQPIQTRETKTELTTETREETEQPTQTRETENEQEVQESQVLESEELAKPVPGNLDDLSQTQPDSPTPQAEAERPAADVRASEEKEEPPKIEAPKPQEPSVEVQTEGPSTGLTADFQKLSVGPGIQKEDPEVVEIDGLTSAEENGNTKGVHKDRSFFPRFVESIRSILP